MIYTVTLNPAIDREYSVAKVAFNSVLRAGSTRNDPGGKGFNVSRMLAVLDQPSTALAFAGGSAGRWLEGQLNDLGIATDFIWVDGETRINTTVVSGEDDDYLKVNEAGPKISSDSVSTLLSKIESLAQPGDWWVLAGSLPPGVPSDFYAQMTKRLKQLGASVFLDTSGEPLSAGLHAKPHWIKPNEHEAAELTGLTDPGQAAEWFDKLGIKNVAISLGSKGVFFVDEDDSHRLLSPKIVEQNPIGAGDAFVGGTVYGLVNSETSIDAIRWGIACGAMAASRPGTDFGTKKEVKELRSKVALEKTEA